MNETKSTSHYSPRAQVLEAAIQAVMQDRNASYGPPESNFQDIADAWNWYLARKLPEVRAKQISAIDVAHMMILMKMARLKYNPMHRDSKVDVAGYAACAAECEPKPTAQNPETISKGVRNEAVKDIIQRETGYPRERSEFP